MTVPTPDLQDQHLADLAKALAHPARLRILRLLRDTPGCIGGEIVGAARLWGRSGWPNPPCPNICASWKQRE